MKLSILIALTGLALLYSCKKGNDGDNGLAGTHTFSGSCNYIFDAFGSREELDSTETLTTAIFRPTSKDSADYVYVPVEYQDEPMGGVYFKLSTLPAHDTGPVAIQVTDTVLTIPMQFPVSGFGCYIEGDGSVVNGRITLRYHTFYRGYNKYSTIVSSR